MIIGYNYLNLKITTEVHKSLLEKQDYVEATLDEITTKLRNLKIDNVIPIRCLNKQFNYFVFAVNKDDILLFRYDSKEDKLYDEIDIKDITDLFETDAFASNIIRLAKTINKDIFLSKPIVDKIDNYTSHFYTTQDFVNKTEEDFVINIDELEDDGFNPGDE